MKKLVLIAALAAFTWGGGLMAETLSRDIVVYGSSPAALAAAIQAKRMGVSCVIVSPEARIGGLTTGGLGQTDIGNKNAFGGIAIEFYKAVADYYRDAANWTREKETDYAPDGQCSGSMDRETMWTFEPSAALKILEGWERRDGLDIRRGEWLDRASGGVVKRDGRILSFRTLSGNTYRGKVFIDATYEGDLLAAAGVSYFVGREGNEVYGETISGIQRRRAKNHQIRAGVSGYVVPGDPSSGLLPGLEPDTDAPDGTGDRRVQAYCFRMCLTDLPENRIPFRKPKSYDERNYELLFRDFAAVPKAKLEANPWAYLPWINSRMPNRKTDTNNCKGFSTDFIGQNWQYPEADYATRREILKAHLDYQRGLMWTLANHPRIPEPIRRIVSKWGTCRDEFTDGMGDGWQAQLYVREARRMIGEYVVTENDVRRKRFAERPIAMAAYGMDSHNARRYVDSKGFVHNEGNIEDWSMGGKPYPLDYRCLLPKRTECENLIVPVCVSSSHMAFGSIRMEPAFFALGQAAGTAAALAVEKGTTVQDVPYAALRARLLADGQVLTTVEYTNFRAAGPMPKPLVSGKAFLRDPFILAAGGQYWLYDGAGYRTSKTLDNWSVTKPSIIIPEGVKVVKWGVWAPEVHFWKGDYYLFATVTEEQGVRPMKAMAPNVDDSKVVPRGTWIFKAKSPAGPFVAVKNGPVTPPEEEALDGTLYVEDGVPYLVYCHEFCQTGDGLIKYAPLTPGLDALAAKPKVLIAAASKTLPGAGRVTDGPFLYKSEKSGRLLYLIWSNIVEGCDYSVLVRSSPSGRLDGPWTKDEILYGHDGGHAMIFKTLTGELRLLMHQPNSGHRERFRIFALEDDGTRLRIR